jgi:hypothetical protein
MGTFCASKNRAKPLYALINKTKQQMRNQKTMNVTAEKHCHTKICSDNFLFQQNSVAVSNAAASTMKKFGLNTTEIFGLHPQGSIHISDGIRDEVLKRFKMVSTNIQLI